LASIEASVCAVAHAEDCASERDALDLPVLRGGLRHIIYTIGDRAKNVTAQVVHVEGDPDHPTNRGRCAEGFLAAARIMNDRRLLKPRCAGRWHGMAGHFVGRCDQRNVGAREKDAR